MIRPNNLGQNKNTNWGILGKRKNYTNEAFKVIELEKERQRYDWKAKLLPWSGIDKGQLVVMMPSNAAPTPPPPTGELWNEVSTNWEATSDNWNNI